MMPTAMPPNIKAMWTHARNVRSFAKKTCVFTQNRKRNHPRHRAMATSRMNEVSTPRDAVINTLGSTLTGWTRGLSALLMGASPMAS